MRLSRDDLKGVDGVWSEALILFNPHDGPVPFKLPDSSSGSWACALTTGDAAETGTDVPADFELPARSLTLLHPA